MVKRSVRPVFGVVLLLLGTGGCATSKPPFKLQVNWDLGLTVGGSHRVEAILSNQGKTDFRFEKGSGLYYSIGCHRSIDPPKPLESAIVASSGVVGGVFGGVSDMPSDPTDPFYCRAAPPAVITLPADGSLPFSAFVKVPPRCVEGSAEVEVYFSAPDFGRKCPGIWQGEVRHVKHRVPLRHLGGEERIAPTASPAALECSLAMDGPDLTVKLKNPTAKPWRARTIPALELLLREEIDISLYWSPLSLAEPSGPLPIDRIDLLELPAHGELVRTVSLGDLAWSEDHLLDWPTKRLETLPKGSYQVRMRLEVLGGKSWEFHCGWRATSRAGGKENPSQRLLGYSWIQWNPLLTNRNSGGSIRRSCASTA